MLRSRGETWGRAGKFPNPDRGLMYNIYHAKAPMSTEPRTKTEIISLVPTLQYWNEEKNYSGERSNLTDFNNQSGLVLVLTRHNAS